VHFINIIKHLNYYILNNFKINAYAFFLCYSSKINFFNATTVSLIFSEYFNDFFKFSYVLSWCTLLSLCPLVSLFFSDFVLLTYTRRCVTFFYERDKNAEENVEREIPRQGSTRREFNLLYTWIDVSIRREYILSLQFTWNMYALQVRRSRKCGRNCADIWSLFVDLNFLIIIKLI